MSRAIKSKVLDVTLYYALNFSPNGGSYVITLYYVLNLQGDVVALMQLVEEDDGSLRYHTIANYTYNAWGELLSITDKDGNAITNANNIGVLNPIRYRGYYYDAETGFYYLQSRYYDPVSHRFINADGYASTETGFLGYNMFAYCNNNPVVYVDPSGNFTEIIEFVADIYDRGLSAVLDALSIKENDYLNELQMKINATIIYGYLSQQGWSHNAICATLGNMQRESTISPGRHQVGGGAFGLVQWDPATKYTDWAGQNGYANDSITGQLKYLIYSMKPGKGEWFKNSSYSEYYLDSEEFICSTNSIEYLTAVFLHSYERAGVAAIDDRIKYALDWSAYFNKRR